MIIDEKLVNIKEKCSGCGLCAKKCPKNAIEMKGDGAGYFYPYIDKSKCVNCGICKKICEYSKPNETNEYSYKEAFIAFSKDNDVLNTTASGGAFSTIAKAFLETGGIVYGATLFNDNNLFYAKHIRITNVNELDKIKGSKYLQSNIYDIYEKIEEDIRNNKKVLFSGTPCQVLAIKKYIGENKSLFTIDIICHGVPSNKLFNDYISNINKKKKIDIKHFNFRDKSKGWGNYYYSYLYFNKSKGKIFKKIDAAYNSSYYQLFLDSYICRVNCYSCPYTNTNRVSDITLGDCWGIEQEYKELIKKEEIDITKGVSCLLVNSSKGKDLLHNVKNNLYLYIADIEKIKKHNMQLNKPCTLKHERDIIINNYIKDGYDYVEKFYRKHYEFKNYLKNIWFRIPKSIRKVLKRRRG